MLWARASAAFATVGRRSVPAGNSGLCCSRDVSDPGLRPGDRPRPHPQGALTSRLPAYMSPYTYGALTGRMTPYVSPYMGMRDVGRVLARERRALRVS